MKVVVASGLGVRAAGVEGGADAERKPVIGVDVADKVEGVQAVAIGASPLVVLRVVLVLRKYRLFTPMYYSWPAKVCTGLVPEKPSALHFPGKRHRVRSPFGGHPIQFAVSARSWDWVERSPY